MRTNRFALPAMVAAGAFLVLSGACAPLLPATADVPEAQRHVAELHRAKCGNCHVRVEPGTHTQAQLESAFTRHRTRVHLSEDEWGQLIEYLAQPSTTGRSPGGYPPGPRGAMQPQHHEKEG